MNVTNPTFLEKVKQKVNVQMNNFLLTPFGPDDVNKAIDSIGGLKSLRQDGLHAF